MKIVDDLDNLQKRRLIDSKLFFMRLDQATTPHGGEFGMILASSLLLNL